jgi:hypothetical protein
MFVNLTHKKKKKTAVGHHKIKVTQTFPYNIISRRRFTLVQWCKFVLFGKKKKTFILCGCV